MTRDRWENIIGQVKDSFKVEDEGREHLDEQGGIDKDFIIFSSPLGRIKLEFISKPVVINKITNYSNRIGSETNVKYIYSETEKSEKMVAYKWDEGRNDWIEMEAGVFEL